MILGKHYTHLQKHIAKILRLKGKKSCSGITPLPWAL
jgi:hypothetical protein